jgi:ankyrin repeat protein
LLERGADVNAPGNNFTALQAAARTGNINIAVELLRRGAHVAAAPSSEGTTAINAAAKSGREDMLQLLLDHYDGNGDLRHVCQDAAIRAEKEWHPEIAEWLRGYAVSEV